MRVAVSTVALLLATGYASAQRYYEGMECTDDCSGHRAGYEWAMENDITDEDDCSSNSASFDEGCQSYIDNPDRDDTTVDDDGDPIDD